MPMPMPRRSFAGSGPCASFRDQILGTVSHAADRRRLGFWVTLPRPVLSCPVLSCPLLSSPSLACAGSGGWHVPCWVQQPERVGERPGQEGGRRAGEAAGEGNMHYGVFQACIYDGWSERSWLLHRQPTTWSVGWQSRDSSFEDRVARVFSSSRRFPDVEGVSTSDMACTHLFLFAGHLKMPSPRWGRPLAYALSYLRFTEGGSNPRRPAERHYHHK